MISANSKHTLLIFVKYPEPGKVKTRLAKNIGKERAAQTYSDMAKTVIHNVRSSEYETIIFFDPLDRKSDVEGWLQINGRNLFPQKGKSLGERMKNAFREAFSIGAKKAVIIGTDCVEISYGIISEAFHTLGKVDVVIGPAVDGGYYLLGLKEPTPEIFNDIHWSTSLVLNQTLKKLMGRRLEFKLLKTLKDIDTVADLSDNILLKIQETENEQ